MRPLPLLAAAALLLGAAGSPSPEHGGRQEALFVEACLRDGSGLSACHCLEEQLQARLGYEGFLELAEQGPAGFRGAASTSEPVAAAQRLCLAADWAEPNPAGQSRWAGVEARPSSRWAALR